MAVAAGVKRLFHQIHGQDQDSSAARAQPSIRSPSAVSSKAGDATVIDSVASTLNKMPRKADFRPSASLVLIGVRGVGKSSLGVLAASAYDRRLVDSERAFHEATGSTTAAYRLAYGAQAYQVRHNEVLQATLEAHTDGAVIVCTFSDLEKKGASLVRRYAQSHPVIHVMRDAAGVQSYLNNWPLQRVSDLLSISNHMLRSCTNYDFYNLSESPKQPNPSDGDSALNGDPLTLKRVQRDFLRLLRNIIGDEGQGPFHRSAYPLSQLDLRHRSHTFAATVNVNSINSSDLDLDEVQIGADCIDIVYDLDPKASANNTNDIDRAFSIVRRASILPMMVSIRRKPGSGPPNYPLLREYTEYCLRLGPELSSIDMSLEDSQIKKLIQNKGKTMVIGTWEFDERPAQGWLDLRCTEVYERAARFGCDLVKITMPADKSDDEDDAFKIHNFRNALHRSLPSRPGLIAYSTGPRGRLSKCFNQILTPVTLHGSTTDWEAPAPDFEHGVSAKQLTQARHAMFRLQPLKFWVYGANVSQSLSPAMHNAAYGACGMRYICDARSSATMDELMKLTKHPSFGGAAIAQPFKTEILPLLDGMSAHAKSIGAVNTVVPIRERLADGSVPDEWTIVAQRTQQGATAGIFGYNSDWIGIRACIRRGLSPANTIRPQSCGLVIGAGGMARAAIYAILSLGVQNIFICNRNRDRAAALAHHYNGLIETGQMAELNLRNAPETRVRVLDSLESSWPAEFRPVTTIVCCIPRETVSGTPINFSLPEEWLKSPTGGVVLELSYSQPAPPLVEQIKSRSSGGWILMDGFDMVPEQAFSQYELFTGRRAPRELMRDAMMKYHPSAKR